jgi:hypothetical protein
MFETWRERRGGPASLGGLSLGSNGRGRERQHDLFAKDHWGRVGRGKLQKMELWSLVALDISK